MTNKLLAAGNASDQGSARLYSQGQVKRITLKELVELRKLKLRSEKNLMISNLISWDLQSTPEAMITYRTQSNDYFDYMEVILLDNN